MELNIAMEDSSSLTCGALLLSVVYHHSPWIHKQFCRGQVFFFFFSGTVYMKPEGSQASQLTDAMGKENFHIMYSKNKNTSYESSGSNSICRIKVMMATFLTTLYSIIKL